jgi:hypothetical protein
VKVVYNEEKYYNPLVGYSYGNRNLSNSSGFFMEEFNNFFENKKIKLDISCFLSKKKIDMVFL